jgi:hypothetical protein
MNPYNRTVLSCTQSSPLSLKVLLCVLFVFFNRAQRVLRNGSTLVNGMDLRGIALLPLIASAVLHTTLMCPGLVVATRGGRVMVAYTLLHMLLLHAVAMLLVTTTLDKYITTATFLSVLLASHFCIAIRPMQPDLVQSQKLLYGYVTRVSAYTLPVMCWIILPVLRVHELEAIVLLYVPEALCFLFAHAIQFSTLLLHVAVVSTCSVMGIAGGEN